MAELDKEKRLAELRLKIDQYAKEAKRNSSTSRWIRGAIGGTLSDFGKMAARGTVATGQGISNLAFGVTRWSPVGGLLVQPLLGDGFDLAQDAVNRGFQKVYDSNALKYSKNLTGHYGSGTISAMETALPTLLTMGSGAVLKAAGGAGKLGGAARHLGGAMNSVTRAPVNVAKSATAKTVAKWAGFPRRLQSKAGDLSAKAYGKIAGSDIGRKVSGKVGDFANSVPSALDKVTLGRYSKLAGKGSGGIPPVETAGSMLREAVLLPVNMSVRASGKSTISETRDDRSASDSLQAKVDSFRSSMDSEKKSFYSGVSRLNGLSDTSSAQDILSVIREANAYFDKSGVSDDERERVVRQELYPRISKLPGYRQAVTNELQSRVFGADSPLVGRYSEDAARRGIEDIRADRTLDDAARSESIAKEEWRLKGYLKNLKAVTSSPDSEMGFLFSPEKKGK